LKPNPLEEIVEELFALEEPLIPSFDDRSTSERGTGTGNPGFLPSGAEKSPEKWVTASLVVLRPAAWGW
jgi:hypothetical protein